MKPLQVVRMKVIFQMMRIRKVLRLMRTKLTSLPMIHPKVAIPILQELDINTVRMRITLSFVILIFPKRGQILMEKMMIGILLTIIRETWKAEREWLKVRV